MVYVYNHYVNQPIVLVAGSYAVPVGPASKRKVEPKAARDIFVPGTVLRFYTVGEGKTRLPLAAYRINRPVDAVHVGQITTRFNGGTWDDQFVVSSNAVQGRPYIHIHNVTDQPLQLNENISIPPNTMFTYTGRHHFGVPLGLILRDPQHRYPTLQITRPVTDVYYGLVSQELQPIYGGWQNIFDTRVDFGDYFNAYGRVERIENMTRNHVVL